MDPLRCYGPYKYLRQIVSDSEHLFLRRGFTCTHSLQDQNGAMPTVRVGRDRLYAALGKTYSELPFLNDLSVMLSINFHKDLTESVILLLLYLFFFSARGIRRLVLQFRDRARRRCKHFTVSTEPQPLSLN